MKRVFCILICAIALFTSVAFAKEQQPQISVTLYGEGQNYAETETFEKIAEEEKGYTVINVGKRELTALLTGTRVYEKNGEVAPLSAVTPIWTGKEQDVSAPRPNIFSANGSSPEGYNYYYSGYGQDSVFGAVGAFSSGNYQQYNIVQFLLTDETDKNSTVYCLDLNTYVKQGWWYKLENLEDAGYYPDENAESHIRAIVNNGYFGTADGEPGSLSKMRSFLEDAKNSGVAVLQGHDFTKLTEGEAQAVTQMAIWRYGNRVDNETFTLSAAGGNSQARGRIDAAYSYFTTLTQEASETTLMTKDNFIESLTLTVKDKTGDGYLCDLAFNLGVTPNEKDNMVLSVALNGQNRAQAKLNEGQREYVFKDLILPMGENIDLSLDIIGTQYLQTGVYIYSSQEENGEISQSFVGLAKGDRSVDIEMNAALAYDVTDATIITQFYSANPDTNDATPLAVVLTYCSAAAIALLRRIKRSKEQ